MDRRQFISLGASAAVLGLNLRPGRAEEVQSEPKTTHPTPPIPRDAQTPFCDRFLSAPVTGGFRDLALNGQPYNVWCGSVIQGEDGRYHMFASGIPKRPGAVWVLDSVVVRAVSETPEGPYQFAQVVLPPRGAQYWDGMMTHNPTIHKCGDTYLLYYTGATYPIRKYANAWMNKRIGLATAKSVLGPWTRRDKPILEPRPDKWDRAITSNAAPCVHPDGRVILVYKSTPGSLLENRLLADLRLGVAGAKHWDGPYQALTDQSILGLPGKQIYLEDAYIWKDRDGWYHMLVKVFNPQFGGEAFAGLHAISTDGVDWRFAPNWKGYSRTVKWNDGRVTVQHRLERVQALVKDGEVTHLFFATRDTSSSASTYNMCIPVAKA